MKLICDCGLEIKFVMSEDYKTEEESLSESGYYKTWDIKLMSAWAEHDMAGFACEKCNKAIWWFA